MVPKDTLGSAAEVPLIHPYRTKIRLRDFGIANALELLRRLGSESTLNACKTYDVSGLVLSAMA
jgi:hypothetical protein